MPNKYKDDMLEAYIDEKEGIYDYGTAPYTGDGNVIDTNHTGISFYDQFLGTKELDYLHNKKNLKGEIVMMSPHEYYEECAYKIFNTTVSKLKRERGEYDKHIIEKLHKVLHTYKRKLCMPMLNYAEKGQEGLHRMFAIGELFGWNYEVPVLVVTWYDEERHTREVEEEKQYKIHKAVEKAITETLRYQFTDLEDLTIQLQSELVRQFKYDNDVFIPENIDVKENDESIVLTFLNNEYPIDRDEIRWREEDIDDELDVDDIELETDEDFLVRYFGKDWRTTYPHLKDTFHIKEDVSNVSIDKDTVVEVLEEHNHSYYQDSTMALECICEKLYYDHNIDARYRGRSIYIGDKKIATIKVDREAWNRVGMYDYTLFI